LSHYLKNRGYEGEWWRGEIKCVRNFGNAIVYHTQHNKERKKERKKPKKIKGLWLKWQITCLAIMKP
jgi:hypothetical protein